MPTIAAAGQSRKLPDISIQLNHTQIAFSLHQKSDDALLIS
jgi:hypothetical protein